MDSRNGRKLSTWSMGLLCILMLAGVAVAAQFFGAIYTSLGDGATVNGNIYQAKADVYLNGGPQNASSAGLPDGTYYFQVTDPSGAVLLSTDDAICRQVTVSGGKMAGHAQASVDAGCAHANGAFNASNGTIPVQLIPYNDTPNHGGEYKAWLIAQTANTTVDGAVIHFVDSDTKTDNFKVRTPAAAYVTVCKFNDRDGNGTQGEGEPLIPHWPITATGVDAGDLTNQTVHTQTDDAGCVSFAVTGFPNDGTQTVTLTEGTLGVDWAQTAPTDGSNPPFTVSGGVISVILSPGDNLTAPNFGNHNPNCETGCDGTLLVTKDANPSNKFTWGIEKSVDNTQIDISSGSATFNYTVTVTHDAGTGWVVNGTIRVSNNSPADISGITVTDEVDNGGTCTINDANGGLNETVEAGEHIDVPYTCTYDSLPSPGTNTATASWANGQVSGTAAVDFTNAIIDGSVNVTDTLGGSLGTVSYSDASPKTFTYSYSVTGVPGTCVTQDNTATFTTDTTETTGSSSQSVRVCEGADLTVSKTASTAYLSSITKEVDKTTITRVGGSATFNYTVKVTTSAWTVSGNITVTNPNDWEAITANVGDSLSDGGGSCTVTGGTGVSVGASSSVTLPYSCTFSSVPSANSGVNTASVTWDAGTAFTPGSSAAGTANYAFSSLTVTDTFNNATNTLGTVTVPPGTATFTYSRSVPAPQFNCVSYTNTAVIVQTEQSASQTVTVCGPLKTGALTMGFWQNKNGQGIIRTSDQAALGNFLRAYHPFSNAPSTNLAAYVSNIIKVAQCTTASKTCNTMLRAQMLATALDVYFSDPALGGNRIGALTPIGGVVIDLTKVGPAMQNVSAAFGGATSMSIWNMLAYQNISDPAADAGAIWYGQVKALQVLAKNAFDAINNQQVVAP